MIARKLGVTIADIQNIASSFGTAGAAKVATMWRSFFGFKRSGALPSDDL